MFTPWEIRTGPEEVAWHPVQPGGAPAAHHVLDPAATVPRPAPIIHGTPIRPDCLGAAASGTPAAHPALTLDLLPDARVAGWETALMPDGTLHTNIGFATADDLAERGRSAPTGHHGFLLENSRIGLRPQTLIAEAATALMIVGAEPTNFGSFLLRMLPQILALRETPVAPDLLIVPARTPWMMEALRLAGLDAVPALTAPEAAGFRFVTVYKFSGIQGRGVVGRNGLARLRHLAGRLGVASPARLYVSRRLQHHTGRAWRRLVNEPAVEALARDRGYRIVRPETLSLAAQIRVFAAARAVAGPSGSGLLTAAFSPAGTPVLDLEYDHETVEQHANLYATTEKRAAFAFGRPLDQPDRAPTARDFAVDLDLVAAALQPGRT